MAAHIQSVRSTILESIERIENMQHPDDASSLLVRLEYLNLEIINRAELPDSVVSDICLAINLLKEYCDSQSQVYSLPVSQLCLPGRPAFEIRKEQLEYLVEAGFSVPQMSNILGVSKRTVERRMASFGIRISGKYSDISEEALDEKVRRIQQQSPGVGLRMLKGYLESQGMKIQRERVRQSLARTDPSGVFQRWRESVRRRIYNVHAPQSLWHIDGNHKLIRWRIVVHGGIDGFSRLPVYLHASNNNRAETVLSLFQQAISEYGLPSRVRCDKGGENYDVAWFMLNHQNRGPGRGSIIAGRSTHNQRIERLWRDVFQGCLKLFYDLFYYLESLDLLDPTNCNHLWCLHYVYMPMINEYLANWRCAWSRHPMRTEKNLSPLQLWVRGTHATGMELNTSTNEDYGVDWQGPLPMSDGVSIVAVPDTPCPFNSSQLSELEQNLTWITNDTYRVNLFNDVVTVVNNI